MDVIHADQSKAVYPLDRLTKLYDGIEQLEDDMWAGEGDPEESTLSSSSDSRWVTDENGVWHLKPEGEDEDEWEEAGEEYEDDEDDDDDEMDVDEDEWDEDDNSPSTQAESMTISRPETPRITPNGAGPTYPPPNPLLNVPAFPDLVERASDDPDSDASGDGLPWKRFDILSSTPLDHAFYGSNVAEPSKSFLGRLRREYRVLSNSLPGMSRKCTPLQSF